jgi:hypothetical protein
LLKWNENFVHAKVDGKELVAAQQKPAVLADGRVISYAAGLMLWEIGGVKEVAHSGSTGGYRAWLGRYPEVGILVAVMCNSGEANAVRLGRQTAPPWTGGKEDATKDEGTKLEGMYRNVGDNTVVKGEAFLPGAGGRVKEVTPNGEIFHEKVQEWKATAKEVEEFIGGYESAETASRVEIGAGVKPGELTLRVGDTNLALRPTFRDGFEAGDSSFVFRRDGAGKVVTLSVGHERVWDSRFERVVGLGRN